jgi:nucleolin
MENATPVVEESNKLYVGQLNYKASEEMIANLFGSCGTVGSVCIIKYQDTGKPKGFAFVDMGSVDEAKDAIKHLNDQEFMERRITVSFARNNKKKEENVFESIYTGGVKLYVGNLSYDSTEDSIQKYFESVGGVTSVKIVMDRDKDRSKGFCFVDMNEEDGAKAAVEKLNNQIFEGRKLNVSSAKDKPRN